MVAPLRRGFLLWGQTLLCAGSAGSDRQGNRGAAPIEVRAMMEPREGAGKSRRVLRNARENRNAGACCLLRRTKDFPLFVRRQRVTVMVTTTATTHLNKGGVAARRKKCGRLLEANIAEFFNMLPGPVGREQAAPPPCMITRVSATPIFGVVFDVEEEGVYLVDFAVYASPDDQHVA